MQQKELTAQVDSSFFTRFVDFSTGNAYNKMDRGRHPSGAAGT